MCHKITKHMSVKNNSWVEKTVDLNPQQAHCNVREGMQSFQECNPNRFREGLDDRTTQDILGLIDALQESCDLAHEIDEDINRDQCNLAHQSRSSGNENEEDLREKQTKIRETAKLIQLKVSQLEDILESYRGISADEEQREEEGLCKNGLLD